MTALVETIGPDQAATPSLDAIWSDEPGIPGFLATVDHKRIAIRYLVTAVAFLMLGGVEAMVIRAQLAGPNGTVVGPETYNRIMTMHGTTMIFLFNTPVFAGFGNYLVPLMIGAREMAFPRVNAFSYWVYVLSGLFLYSSFTFSQVPDGGWFAYTPLTSSAYSPGIGLDLWAMGVVFLGISTTAGGINFAVTILRMRAPGMTLNRLPLFCWSILTMSFMIIFALPAITLAGLLLELDRAFGMRFFDPAGGGDPLLYQHLFWIWGHPEVYILFIPATGIISMIVATFTRVKIVGYHLVVAALVATGFISFGLWVHHMFATGVPLLVTSFFSAASLVVAIPSGVQIFAWLATMIRGRVIFEVPMLFAIGFVVTFVIGGMTGVMVGVVPFDQQVTDSYFVVAHFHYVLIGGTVFPAFAGLHYWFPKAVGRMPSRRLGIWSFWLTFVGTQVTFFPQHLLGLAGMPRRIWTYPADTGWGPGNLWSSVGSVILGIGLLLSVIAFALAWRRGPRAGADPWGGESLEWSIASPPPPYNFAGIPVVRSDAPMWDQEDAPEVITAIDAEDLTIPAHGHHRAVLTSVLDAADADVVSMPHPSLTPLALAVGLTTGCAAIVAASWMLGVAALAIIVVSFVRWHDGSGS
ncbi:cytochrome c oxidase subunit I [Aquihabitans sp. McL0605]|uniref:cytochrome c oxidase subunit I n=1 Tax=Aquihabitans sp. McL0605 TaxID=3415671 RepID=UPI003CE946B4